MSSSRVPDKTVSAPRRDDRLDFLRGLALLIIFIDHVPKNVFQPFTLHAFAFSDAAEMFFFISGYVAALVYGRAMLRQGFVAAARRVWRRAGVVYGAQMLLLVAVLALVRVFVFATGDQNFLYIFRVGYVFSAPLAYVVPALTMHFQPGYLDILPSYVLLLAFFPLALAGLKRNVWLVLVPSFALWLAVQVGGLTLWTTQGERWFFDPFAWQLLFVIGAVFGHPSLKGRMQFLDSPWLFWTAAAFTAAVAVVQLSVVLHDLVPAVPRLRPEGLPLDKPTLEPLRILSLCALALVADRCLPAIGTLSRSRLAMLVIRCGRFSLQVFSFGVLLSSLTAVTWVLFGDNYLLQSLACVAGVGAQFAFAAFLEWARDNGGWLTVPLRALVSVPIAERERRD